MVENNDDTFLLPVVNTVASLWLKRDGGTSGEISPLIGQLLVAQPDLMLSVFAAHMVEFENWLGELQSPMFTDFTGEKSEGLKLLLNDLQDKMIEYSRDGDPRLAPIAERLVEELKDIQVRTVD